MLLMLGEDIFTDLKHNKTPLYKLEKLLHVFTYDEQVDTYMPVMLHTNALWINGRSCYNLNNLATESEIGHHYS